MDDPPKKRRRIAEAERQFIKIELFTMAGETVQSLLVPSTIHGRELLDLVLPAHAHHGSVAKLLHGVSAINKSAPISAQGITDCARLTLLRIPISDNDDNDKYPEVTPFGTDENFHEQMFTYNWH